MSQICHLHCPSPGGGGAGMVAMVAAAGSATAAISAVIGDIVLCAGIVVTVLVITGTWYLVHVLRRDRQHLSGRQSIASLAQAQRPAIAPARQAITGVHVITDAPETFRIPVARDDGGRG
jgi:hypothetical protein